MESVILKKLQLFFSAYKSREFKQGEMLITAYEDPKGVFFLEEGTVKMYFISKDGEEVVLNIFKPFTFFPMSWAINSTPNTYFYEAITKAKTRFTRRTEVIKFLKENPDILYDLLSRVYNGTDGILERMSYLMTGNGYSRLVTELIILAKRFGMKKGRKIKIIIAEKDLAADTGMTRETISRELKKLKDKGLITLKNKELVINDLNKLSYEIS
jgi:CRP-like cAMP-binding protein